MKHPNKLHICMIPVHATDMAGAPSEQFPKDVVVVAVPFPAHAHLNVLLHFSLFLSSYGVTVYYAATANHNRQAKERIQGWDADALLRLRFHDLECSPFANPGPDRSATSRFPNHLLPSWLTTLQLHVPFASFLRSVAATARRVVVLHDFFVPFARRDAAPDISNGEWFAFQCIPAFYQLDMMLQRNQPKQTQLLGDSDSKTHDLILASFDGSFGDEKIEFLDSANLEIPGEVGVVLNSSRAFDDKFINLLARDKAYCDKKMFVVGPLNPLFLKREGPASTHDKHEIVAWLDNQPPASVVYVAFGSTVTLPEEQIKQMAEGLRRSGQRFLWVLRDADRANIYEDDDINAGSMKVSTELQGSKEMVVQGWAPQMEILAHRSTAAFVSHCGWNSCMESLAMGVPIIAWPMHSDQPKNAMFLTEYLNVGILMTEWQRRAEIVSSERIAEVISKMLVEEEGKVIREKAKVLGEAIRAGMKEGGDSRNDLENFVKYITRC